jgi:hypothetical protein
MIVFITYGDDKYINSKNRIAKEAADMNIFDNIIILGPNDLPANIPDMTKKVLNLPRGGGYWIWKPLIIKHELDKIQEDDILVYVDAGCYLNKGGINRFNEYFNYISDKTNNKSLIRFYMDFIQEYKYTTSSILKYFNVENNNEITNSGQYVGGIQIIRKCDNSIRIINKWYNVAIEKPLLFTDFYNNIDKHNEFVDNRHDQSIFSIITKLNKEYVYSIKDETYPYNDKYPIYAGRIRG